MVLHGLLNASLGSLNCHPAECTFAKHPQPLGCKVKSEGFGSVLRLCTFPHKQSNSKHASHGSKNKLHGEAH
jgi:hypothetical protein